MAQGLRVFTRTGLEAFQEILTRYRHGSKEPPDQNLLNHSAWTAAIPGGICIERRSWASRLDAARYLTNLLQPLCASEENIRDPGLWGWLSFYYFDAVCPQGSDGTRNPGRDYRHIPDKVPRTRHRHLLRGPWQVYSQYGEKGSHLLLGPVSSESTIFHEVASRQDLISNPSIVELTRLLYFDERKGRIKPGAQAGLLRAGSVNRLVYILMQLDMTYDLHGMGAGEIDKLLPQAEFEQWVRRCVI